MLVHVADRRSLEEDGIGTEYERDYVATFFDRSRLNERQGESMRELCERLQIKTQVLGLKECQPVGRQTQSSECRTSKL